MNETNFPLEDIKGLLTFKISGNKFCADMNVITAIINPEELNQDVNIESDDPHIVLGAIKIPIINFYELFGYPRPKRTEAERILVLEASNKMIGFFVERVEDIYSIDKEMRTNMEYISFNALPNVIAILKYRDEQMYLLDLNRVIIEGGR